MATRRCANGSPIPARWSSSPRWTTASCCSSASSAIPLRRIFTELPAGKIDAGEHPLDTARRELREETGHTAKFWRHLATMHPCIGYSDERIEIFWAQGLIYVGHQRDHGEHLDVIE
jgi:8-oxo-dGTP pyrophosphatase MutT (NUDIX family)